MNQSSVVFGTLGIHSHQSGQSKKRRMFSRWERTTSATTTRRPQIVDGEGGVCGDEHECTAFSVFERPETNQPHASRRHEWGIVRDDRGWRPSRRRSMSRAVRISNMSLTRPWDGHSAAKTETAGCCNCCCWSGDEPRSKATDSITWLVATRLRAFFCYYLVIIPAFDRPPSSRGPRRPHATAAAHIRCQPPRAPTQARTACAKAYSIRLHQPSRQRSSVFASSTYPEPQPKPKQGPTDVFGNPIGRSSTPPPRAKPA